MKNIGRDVFLLLGILLYATMAMGTEKTELRIVYASKMPEIENPREGVGGLAELATLVRQIRETDGHSMFLHGGDSLAPSALSSFDHGTHMIDILNEIEPEVVAVNKREFAYKEDELVMRIGEAAFPFVSSNLVDPLTGENLDGVEAHQCFEYGAHQVCVLSVLDSRVKEAYLPERIQTTDSYSVIKTASSNLRAKGADCIILMAGYEFEEVELLLEQGQIDMLFVSSNRRDEVVSAADGRLLGYQGTDKGNVLLIDVVLEDHGPKMSIAASGRVVSLNSYAKDPTVVEKVDYYVGKLSEIMGVEVGTTAVALNTVRANVRSRENGFGNMVADALKDYYGTDIGLINGGSIRGGKNYLPGTVMTRKDVQSELPFRNVGITAAVSGEQLLTAMENGLSKVEEGQGRFPQVSGMEVVYCLDHPPGERVKSIHVGEEPIDSAHTYTVALPDYLYNGGDGYTMFKGASTAGTDKNGMLIWSIVRAYIEKKGVIKTTVEGRLVNRCD